MDNPKRFDDPIWEYLIGSKLTEYLPAVRRWWSEYPNMLITTTGVLDVKYDDLDVPPGLFMRMTNTPVRSPIKHIQAFPFIATCYLNICGVTGGVNKMIERVCKDYTLEEFTIIEKHNLPSTYQKGQILCFVPTSIMQGVQELGKYVYLTVSELVHIARGDLPRTVVAKCHQYL